MQDHARFMPVGRGAVLAILLAAVASYAQLLVPDVSIDTQRLPDEAKTKLAGLDSVLSTYVAAQEWAGDEYQYDVTVQISIFFTDYSPDPQEDKYKAKLIVTNKQDVRLEDTRWEFGLRQPFAFRLNQFHPFKSVIDFYLWMLLGMEYDKLEKLGGRTYVDKAKQVYLESSGSIYYFGWDRRLEVYRNYTSDENQTARELSFFYYTGMYFSEQNDLPKAKDYLYYAVVKLQKAPIDAQRRFLETNHRQFAEALVRAGYPKGVKALMQLDPTHKDVYETLAPREGNK